VLKLPRVCIQTHPLSQSHRILDFLQSLGSQRDDLENNIKALVQEFKWEHLNSPSSSEYGKLKQSWISRKDPIVNTDSQDDSSSSNPNKVKKPGYIKRAINFGLGIFNPDTRESHLSCASVVANKSSSDGVYEDDAEFLRSLDLETHEGQHDFVQEIRDAALEEIYKSWRHLTSKVVDIILEAMRNTALSDLLDGAHAEQDREMRSIILEINSELCEVTARYDGHTFSPLMLTLSSETMELLKVTQIPKSGSFTDWTVT
jgi:hypothetical protein